MDELNRDAHAIWRFMDFLRRRGALVWDHDTAAVLLGEYARDHTVLAEIDAWHYPDLRPAPSAAPCAS